MGDDEVDEDDDEWNRRALEALEALEGAHLEVRDSRFGRQSRANVDDLDLDEDFPEIDLTERGYRVKDTQDDVVNQANKKNEVVDTETLARLRLAENAQKAALEQIAQLTALAQSRAGEVANVRRLLEEKVELHNKKERQWENQRQEAERQISDQRMKFQADLKAMQDEFVFKRMEGETSSRKNIGGGWNSIRRRTVAGQDTPRAMPQTPVPIHRLPLAPLSQQARREPDQHTSRSAMRPAQAPPNGHAKARFNEFAVLNTFEKSPPSIKTATKRPRPSSPRDGDSSPMPRGSAAHQDVEGEDELSESDSDKPEATEEPDTRIMLLQDLFQLSPFAVSPTLAATHGTSALQILAGCSSDPAIADIQIYDRIIGSLLGIVGRIATWGDNSVDDIIVVQDNKNCPWNAMTESAAVALLIELDAILCFAVKQKWVKPIPASILIIGYLLWQSPAACDFGLGSPLYDDYRARHRYEPINVGLTLCTVVNLFCDSYDVWLGEKAAHERAKKEAQAAKLAERQSGMWCLEDNKKLDDVGCASAPSGPVSEDLALIALRHIALLRLDLLPSSEDGLISIIHSTTFSRMLNMHYPPRCLEQLFYLLHNFACANDRVADELLLNLGKMEGRRDGEKALVVLCCQILAETQYSVEFAEIMHLHFSVLGFIYTLIDLHSRIVPILAQSNILLRTLVQCTGHQTMVLWESIETPSPDLIKLVTLCIRVIHVLASTLSTLDHVFLTSQMAHHVFISTMSRIGLSEEAHEFFDYEIVRTARDLLEQVVSPEEEEEIYLQYLPSEEAEDDGSGDPAHVQLFRKLANAKVEHMCGYSSEEEDDNDETAQEPWLNL